MQWLNAKDDILYNIRGNGVVFDLRDMINALQVKWAERPDFLRLIRSGMINFAVDAVSNAKENGYYMPEWSKCVDEWRKGNSNRVWHNCVCFAQSKSHITQPPPQPSTQTTPSKKPAPSQQIHPSTNRSLTPPSPSPFSNHDVNSIKNDKTTGNTDAVFRIAEQHQGSTETSEASKPASTSNQSPVKSPKSKHFDHNMKTYVGYGCGIHSRAINTVFDGFELGTFYVLKRRKICINV